jgi:signal transduction histidine kinase
MSDERREDELIALKTIAETLNNSNDMHQMLNAVLKKLLEVTGLTTGWIFLVDEEPEYSCVVDVNLPPALTWGNKTPMCNDTCWCLDRYWDGRLNHAVNIIECKRIEDAIEYKWGDTEGIQHHATVPLKAGGELFGILNVAAPGKEHFNEKELALLQSVAFQIGTAVKRTRLYHAQQKRAENYAKLGEITHYLGSISEINNIPGEVVRKLGKAFEWPSISFFIREENILSLRALYNHGQVKKEWKTISISKAGLVGTTFQNQNTVVEANSTELSPGLESIGLPSYQSGMAVPLRLRDHTFGVIFVSSEKKKHFDDNDVDVLQALADHISLAMENARLYEQRRELARMEERNRLARDLHDSVCQTLFSLTLTARGTESLLAGQSELADQSLQEIQKLSQDALKEMRSLIWQLRPAGLEQGLLTALKRYGEGLGIVVKAKVESVREIPRAMEEALWRIGQESLNNVSKHAKTSQATISIRNTNQEVIMEVTDQGSGFTLDLSQNGLSMGLASMRERAEMLGGLFSITSLQDQGTKVKVSIPLSIDFKHNLGDTTQEQEMRGDRED